MTITELIGWYVLQARRLKLTENLEPDDQREFVDTAVRMGIQQFWNRHSWTFRFKDYELDVSAGTERFALPDECVGIRSIREKTSLTGFRLTYLPKEVFDTKFPRPLTQTNDRPVYYTAYESDGTLYAKFFPVPNVSTVYLDIMLDKLEDEQSIPARSLAALKATVDTFLFQPGTAQMESTVRIAHKEVMELMRTDSPNKSTPFEIIGDAQLKVETFRPWLVSD